MQLKYPIPVIREEDPSAYEKRREEYAQKRDKQAVEFNQAITKRIISGKKHLLKCKQCGKEFDSDGSEYCPSCFQTVTT